MSRAVVDAGRPIDWGRTSEDYAAHRPGPPDSLFRKLAALDVGLAGQRILDLGTGTGALALALAGRGARVQGIDVAEGQIRAARRRATEAGLDVGFQVAPAEEIPFPERSFDVVTAGQCWGYFDAERAVPEVLRVLAPGGLLVTTHFSFLPRLDPVARASEALVLRYNPDWGGADWSGRVPARPAWSRGRFVLRGMFVYDEPILFTRESWRGRMRALRGVGASLAPDAVEAFDAEHDALLRRIAPERFHVLHRIDAHLLAPSASDGEG